MLSAQPAARSYDLCMLVPSTPGDGPSMFDDPAAVPRLRQLLARSALAPDACRAIADAVRRHGYLSQRSLDVAGIRDELCLRWQRVAAPALLSLFKTPAVWTAIAADLLPDDTSLRHVVLPFVADPRELADIVLAAFAAGVTSVEVSFPPPGHAASPYKLDLSGWVPQHCQQASDRLVLWIQCVPDAEGCVLAPQGVDLGVHPLTGVHVPGVKISEPAVDAATRGANASSSMHYLRAAQSFGGSAPASVGWRLQQVTA